VSGPTVSSNPGEAAGPGAAAAVLEATGITKRFGGVQALRGVSLRLVQGELVGLIGPNGSGKTTFLNCISGVLAPSSGEVLLDRRRLTGRPVHSVARAGVVRTFQNIRLFERLSVLRNVQASALAAGHSRRSRSEAVARELLAEMGLERLADRDAGTLPHGDQRRLEVARALAARPRFLLLDEPAAGMNEEESAELAATIDRIRAERSCGILIVEHDLALIMRICERITVLNEGEVVAEGAPAEVRRDPAVITAYIGEDGGQEDDEKGERA
jgi:ABC-type branched-subunit amino acid transport system ATPase component